MKKIFLISLLFFLTVASAVAQNLLLLTKSERLRFAEQGKDVTYYRILPNSPLRIKVNGPAELGIVIRVVSQSQLNIPPESSFVVTTETGKSFAYKIQPRSVEVDSFFERVDLFPTNPVVLKLKIPQGSHKYTFSASSGNKSGFAIRFFYKPKIIPQKPVVKKNPRNLFRKKKQ